MFFFLFTCPSVSRPLVSRNVGCPVVHFIEGSRHAVFYFVIINVPCAAQLITSMIVLNITLIKPFSHPDFSVVIKKENIPQEGRR